MTPTSSLRSLLLTLCLCGTLSAFAQDALSRFEEMSRRNEARLEGDPFVGVTTDGSVEKGLFKIESTGVSTESIRAAAKAFLASLTPEQKAKTLFPVDDDEWRKWMNQHFYIRQGTGFEEMNGEQRERAFDLLRASLSPEGFQLARNIMKLNHTLGEMQGSMFMLGEWAYWITIMGEPSATEPWGWQIDGHHLIINFFILGDQIVTTPTFVGSEPVIATEGKYAGIEILQEEQDQALAFMHRLSPEQKAQAILKESKPGNDNETEAFSDNVVLPYQGLPVRDLSKSQSDELLEIVGRYVGYIRQEHARLRMEAIKEHWDRTWFAWKGGTDENAVFYYRIHSPVALIEFDHQNPVGLRRQFPERTPIRQHIHVVIRTPNGNDYGKDLLRQHREKFHAP